MANITVIGTGYVGLVTGAGFAHLGHRVTCVDVDADKIRVLRDGGVPIFEEGLLELVEAGVSSGRLGFEHGHSETSLSSEFYFLCVPTPQGPDGSADLSYLEAAAAELGPIPARSIIVNKSTVPVGSTRFVERALKRRDVSVVSNPEFLREGSAVADFMEPDRVVIGSESQEAAARVADLYQSLGTHVLITDPSSAEMIKYASNAFLATKLSFINAVAAVCEGVGADVADVRLGMGYDHRIGMDFLRPGPGWGGSCFPKDTQAMLRIAEIADYDFGLLRSAVETNERQFDRVVDKIRVAAGGVLVGASVGMLGVAFKSGTDDIRRSPALSVAERLIAAGARVKAFDPVAAAELEGLEMVGDAYAAADDADVVAVMTEWDEFKWLDYPKIASVMRGQVVVDARAILDHGLLLGAGLELVTVGRS